MRTAKETLRIGYIAVFVLVHRNYPRRKRPKPGQVIVGPGHEPCILFGARFYDPQVAMWTSTDPKGEFYNPYSYVGGNPANFIDPMGLETDPTEPSEEEKFIRRMEERGYVWSECYGWVNPKTGDQG